MSKSRRNTKRLLHRARVVEEREHSEQKDVSWGWHDAQMRKMLKGVDRDRYERLASGG